MKLTHIDKKNLPMMVDVSEKQITKRTAIAEAKISLPPEVQNSIQNGDLVTAKGPVFHTAIIAGTQAVKKTAELIPFCHTLPIENCKITINVTDSQLSLTCEVTTTAKTGVEMEALTGVTVAALTIYDMCKALSHDMQITDIKLIAKSGGKHDMDKR